MGFKSSIISLGKFLLGKRYDRTFRNVKQIRTFLTSVLIPYRYREERYAETFLARHPKDTVFVVDKKPVDRVIYCFWTGDNPMSEVRKDCLEQMKSACGVEVRLITPSELPGYILPDHPLHPAYPYLSAVHKADYLRCYFMHFYGGGYADIKKMRQNISAAFTQLDKSNAFLIGYPEVGYEGAGWCGVLNTFLYKDLQSYWRLLVGNFNYICRPRTPFTSEWLEEQEHRLDELLPQLKQHPATDPYGEQNGYPVEWLYLLGNVFHPLCLKYNDHILKDKVLTPSFENYR